MRLRYLHLQNYPPISDIKVCFASGSPLARECAIRFVVGVNGSGKSNLLRAVAEVFLALGSGFYRSELRTLLNIWRGDDA